MTKTPFSENQVLLYTELVNIVLHCGLNPHDFSKDIGTIADALGLDRAYVRRLARECEKRGLLIILDPGKPTPNPRTGRYALIGEGETRASVLRLIGETEDTLACRQPLKQQPKRHYVSLPALQLSA